MKERAKARAYANIALVKYWGKRPGTENAPATPSVSLALDKLETVTEVESIASNNDQFYLNGKPAESKAAHRLETFVNDWRDRGWLQGNFRVASENRFPTASGLASSASGFAALTKALSGISSEEFTDAELSQIARRGSGSAARSITGNLSKLPLNDNPAAELLRSCTEIQWGMVICEVSSPEKLISSREGMESSRKTSPYYQAWIAQAKIDYNTMLVAIESDSFTEIGEIAEANALAMHACMIATRPSLVYWKGATVEIVRHAQQLRKGGLETYCTIDAGAHVALLGKLDDLVTIERAVQSIQGVQSTMICRPAGAAEILE